MVKPGGSGAGPDEKVPLVADVPALAMCCGQARLGPAAAAPGWPQAGGAQPAGQPGDLRHRGGREWPQP